MITDFKEVLAVVHGKPEVVIKKSRLAELFFFFQSREVLVLCI